MWKDSSIKLDMAGMFKLSNQEFKTTIINMLRVLMDKVDGKWEHIGKVSKEMKILRMNQKEML